jgi:acyl-CoA thioesterase I
VNLFRALVAALVLAGMPLSPAASSTPTVVDCRSGTEKIPFKADLAALRQKISRGEPAVIVALGSSSTAGVGASSADTSYPSVLEAELRRRLPDADLRVVNRGAGGQRARDMVSRLESDVAGEKPDLVIWQTGSNDAIHDVGLDRLRKNLRKGIAQIQAMGADVVLMDSQWMPRADRYPNYQAYRAAMADAAQEAGIGLFRRYDVMKAWFEAGRLSEAQIIGADGLHMVDTSYYCLGVVLADGITASLAQRVGSAAVK